MFVFSCVRAFRVSHVCKLFEPLCTAVGRLFPDQIPQLHENWPLHRGRAALLEERAAQSEQGSAAPLLAKGSTAGSVGQGLGCLGDQGGEEGL